MARRKAPNEQASINGQSETEAQASASQAASSSDKTPRQGNRPFPAHAFEEALDFAQAIQNSSGSQQIRRLTLFDELGRSPESSASRTLITSAAKYGLVKGSYKSDALELSERGVRATSPDTSATVKARAKIESAIEQVPVFKGLYDKYAGQRLPSPAVMLDDAKQAGTPAYVAQECVDVFVSNLKFVGLLQTLSGAERVLSIDYALEKTTLSSGVASESPLPRDVSLLTGESATFEQTCFVVSPIGEDNSEFRKHADMMLNSFIEPALRDIHLKVVRADQIAESGIITKQIAQYVWHSRLVIADLSFHNPNVFYELALRHAAGKPVIHIIRTADKIPFDLQQSRMIVIDTSDHYTLVARIDTYRSEIATHARRALEQGATTDNPLSIYLPELFQSRN